MSEVKLPRQVRQQMQAAEKITQGILDAGNVANGVVSIAEATAQAAQAEQVLDQPQAPAPAPAAPPAAPVEDFEQKYRTIQGKYNAEVPRLQQQLHNEVRAREETGNRLTQLEHELRQLREKPQSAVLDPKDVESFGADLVDMVRRQANAEITQAVQAQVSGVLSRIAALEQTVTGVSRTTAVTAEQQFYVALEQLVPDFKTINASPKFLEWLGEEDLVHGEIRQAALDRAANSMNPQRAAAVFRAFKQMQPVQAPVQTNELQQQVTPTRSGASVQPAQVSRVMVSQNSITQFYNDMRRGVYRGRDAEAQQIEAEINRALAEGRVA